MSGGHRVGHTDWGDVLCPIFWSKFLWRNLFTLVLCGQSSGPNYFCPNKTSPASASSQHVYPIHIVLFSSISSSYHYHFHHLQLQYLINLVHGITLTTLDQVYDPNGDGQIDEGELKDIIISCVAENGMEFDEQQVILGRHDICQTFTRPEVLPPKFYTNINS